MRVFISTVIFLIQKINENDMRLFLQENEDILKKVTNEHIEKIKKFNRREINEK